MHYPSMIFLTRDISGNHGTCQTMRSLASSALVSLMRDVTLRKGNWHMGIEHVSAVHWVSQKMHRALPRVQSKCSWAGDDDKRLAAMMRPSFPRFGAGVEQTPQPGIHARALCGLRLLAHARSDASTRSADEDCPAGPRKGGECIWKGGLHARVGGSKAFRCGIILSPRGDPSALQSPSCIYSATPPEC